MNNDRWIKSYEPFFGSWKIEEKIGSGFMGTAYRIFRTRFDRTEHAVLKAITIQGGNSAAGQLLNAEEEYTYLRGVVAEIVGNLEKTSSLIACDHIVSYEDIEVKENTRTLRWDILILMREETPLSKWCSEQKPKERDIVKAGTDLVAALNEAKAYGFTHGNIHPGNVFVKADGTFCLGDFGSAAVMSMQPENEIPERTLEYMSPEAYRKDADYQKTADLYSVCLVLYRMAGGETPLQGNGSEEDLDRQRKDAAVKRLKGEVLPVPNGCRKELGEALVKACAYAPVNRYHSPEEFVSALSLAEHQKEKKVLVPGIIAGAAIAAVCIVAIAALGHGTKRESVSSKESSNSTTGSSENVLSMANAGKSLAPSADTEEAVTEEAIEEAAAESGTESGETAAESGTEDQKTEAPSEEKTPKIVTAEVADAAGVYRSPSTGEEGTGELREAEQVQVQRLVNDSEGNLWADILMQDGTEGYVLRENLVFDAEETDIPADINQEYATALLDLNAEFSEYTGDDGKDVLQQSIVATNGNSFGIMLTVESDFRDADGKTVDTKTQTQYLGPGDHAVFILYSTGNDAESAVYSVAERLSVLGSEKKVSLFSYELISRDTSASSHVQNGSGSVVTISLLCFHYDPKGNGAVFSDPATLSPGEETVLTADPCSEDDKIYLFVQVPDEKETE